MLIPLQPTENWDRLNEAYRLLAGYKIENPIKCYQNLYAAVDEVTTQLASFLSHKKAFTWIKGLSPLFDATLPFFLREGFQVQPVDWKVFEQMSDDPTAWVQALNANTLFVLAFEDHAVTGKKMDLAPFEKALADKKIYFIRVSHFSLPPAETEISPFTIWVGPAHTGKEARGIVVCGGRFRAPEMAAPYGPWKNDEAAMFERAPENPELVKKVESEFPDNLVFSENDKRRFDRIILNFQDLSGDSILKRMQQKMGSLSELQAQTTHLCQWNSIKLFKYWWTPQPSAEDLRGLVLFSLDIAQRDDFVSNLKQTLTELRAESQWE